MQERLQIYCTKVSSTVASLSAGRPSHHVVRHRRAFEYPYDCDCHGGADRPFDGRRRAQRAAGSHQCGGSFCAGGGQVVPYVVLPSAPALDHHGHPHRARRRLDNLGCGRARSIYPRSGLHDPIGRTVARHRRGDDENLRDCQFTCCCKGADAPLPTLLAQL